MIRVGIIDNHPAPQRGIIDILRDVGRFRIVAAPSASKLIQAMRQYEVTASESGIILLLLDQQSDGPCVRVVEQLSTIAGVLIVSASSEWRSAVTPFKAGARGYITNTASAEMLIAAVETVAAGGFALSGEFACILHVGIANTGFAEDSHRTQGVRLSAREDEALRLIASGFTHAQVATRMGVTRATVDTYVGRIRAKLQVGNKAELTRAALARWAHDLAGECSAGTGQPERQSGSPELRFPQ